MSIRLHSNFSHMNPAFGNLRMFGMRHFLKRCVVIGIFTLLVGSIVVTFHAIFVPLSFMQVETVEDTHYINESIKKLEKIRQCLLDNFEKTNEPLWNWLYVIILRCTQDRLQKFNVLKFPTDKVYVPLRHATSNDPCVLLTLGVGNDTILEEYMAHKYYPHCKFYGADPIEEVGEPYKKVGKLFPIAVDVDKKSLDLHIMDADSNMKYKMKRIETTPLHIFLHEQVLEPFVHFVSMDIEGSEYRFLDYFTKGTLEQYERDNGLDRVVICQIMLELHGPLRNYNTSRSEFEKLLTDFVANSPFVLLQAYRPLYHHRILAVNARERQCIAQLDYTQILGTSDLGQKLEKDSMQKTLMQVVIPNQPDHYFDPDSEKNLK